MSSAGVAVLEDSARFTLGATEVGRYVLDDGYKPYLHPLRTAGGRVVSLAMPSDHRHHKGLMYALTATDVNWWEEVGVEGYVESPGRQRVMVTEQTGEAEIEQQLLWTDVDGKRETFHERRRICCSWQDPGFVRWEWTTELSALRDVELRHSIWHEQHRGQMVNYHGLGIRFAREFGFDPGAGSWRARGAVGPGEIVGRTMPSVVVTDLVDGEIPAPVVSVRMTQVGTDDGWFAAQRPGFGYLSVGPSVLPQQVRLTADDCIRGSYLVDVADGDPFEVDA